MEETTKRLQNLIPPSAISKSNVLQRQCMILDKIAGLQEKLLFFFVFFHVEFLVKHHS